MLMWNNYQYSTKAPDMQHMQSMKMMLNKADGKLLTWSSTWLLVVLYFSAMASATALVPRNKVFQLCELGREKKAEKYLF